VKSEEMISSPAEFRARSRKIVETPSGFKVEIKRLDVMGIFARTGFLPAFLSAPDTGNIDMAKLFEGNPDQFLNFFNMILLEGISRPKVVDKPYSELADDEVHISDIPFEDRIFLQNAIMEFNGMSTERTEILQNFRSGQARGAGDRQAGEEIRETPS